MTDTINRDKSYHINFNFYIEFPQPQQSRRNNEWDITYSPNVREDAKQVIFTAKKGPLFRRRNER